ncbi:MULTISPECIES: ROK family protein [unclassified Arthrobacter]|uniref:ROK family protein n=1 Tax=unclassified Arthrobacter TaxID=235627 RepID=UPI001CFFC9BA|nr:MULTISPECIES: ROK family protein [unclassified Arthrobacter]MCB5280769.1 N-acetylglucosamine repressor [Arthrobacter sp. ES1]WGZ79471.1 ROK family protein [Arthrobacter sp. EM1]
MTIERVPARLSGATSHGHLLDLIRATGGMSRQQLLASTGMSRATLYERLETLLRRNLIYEAESMEATGGRRSRKIRFEDRGRVVLSFALGQTHATVAVSDTNGRQLRSRSVEHRINAPEDTVLQPLIRIGTELLDAGTGETLIGIGVSVPAPVDAGTGYVVHPTTIPEWEPDAVVTSVSSQWQVPIVVENDARAGALGECTTENETTVYVKVATGIGCGIVVDGTILRGAHGAAGDIGHIHVASDGPLCRCGRRGCLATFSSGSSLIDRLNSQGMTSLDEIARAAEQGQPDVEAQLLSAAEVLGGALAATVTTVNPNRLVLGGTIGTIPYFAERVRSRVLKDVVERIAEGLLVVAGATGDHAAVDGLTRLVMRKVFAPDAIDLLIVDYPIN